MAIISRIILVLSMLMQSLPGLTTLNCAEMMPGTAAPTNAGGSRCSCCRAGDGAMTASCPTGDKFVACRCGMSQPAEPRTPPSNPKTAQTHQFVALLPILLTVLPSKPFVLEQRWTSPPGPPKQSADSIQSLLCVWVV